MPFLPCREFNVCTETGAGQKRAKLCIAKHGRIDVSVAEIHCR